MKTLFQLLICTLLFITHPLKAQSEFLDSKENAFSIGNELTFKKDHLAGTLGFYYTINGALDIGLSYSRLNTTLNRYRPIFGNSFSAYLAAKLLSEAKGDFIGFKMGVIAAYSSFDYKDSWSHDINDHFGISYLGLSASIFKKFKDDLPPLLFTTPKYFKLGIKAFPYAETTIKHDQSGRLNAQYVSFSAGPVLQVNNIHRIIMIEPSVSHNFIDNITYFRFSVSALL